MKKWIWAGAALVVLWLAAVWAGSSYLIAYALTPAGTLAAKSAATEEYLRGEYPWIAPWLDSLGRTGGLRDTTITAPDGAQLHALYAEAPQPTPRTAVIVHGYTDCAARMLMIGYLYHHGMGCNILLPDLRYHGASDGEAIGMGWTDRLDVLRWIEVADERFGGGTRQVVHGISMGAATTMMVSGEERLPACVRCFVEDCGYTSVWDEFRKELREQFSLPAFPLLHAASALCAWRYGWSFREASALEAVRRSRLPMLFIHGDADTFVPTWMVYPLYEAKPGDKELWIVPGATHATSYRDRPEEYTRRVEEFVERYI